MELFHISMDIKEKTKLFVPRIPERIYNGENNTIKRICFSDTVHGCMKAIYVPLFKPETKIMVYRKLFDFNDKNLIHPNEIYNKGYVKDAKANHEYWYLKPVVIVGELYQIINIDYEPCIQWEAVSIDEIKSIIKELAEDDKDLSFIANMNYAKSRYYYDEFIKVCEKKIKQDHIRYCCYEDNIYDMVAENVPQCQGYKINKLDIIKLDMHRKRKEE